MPPRERPGARNRPGRIRRFVLRYGWRAYAVPLLTIATVAVLLDLALSSPATRAAGVGDAAAPAASTPAPALDSGATPPAEGDAGPSQAPQVVGEETYV